MPTQADMPTETSNNSNPNESAAGRSVRPFGACHPSTAIASISRAANNVPQRIAVAGKFVGATFCGMLAAVPPVERVNVDVAAVVPLRVTEVGLTVQVESSGAPEQVRVTVPVKPPCGVTVRVKFSLNPLATVLPPVKAIEKSSPVPCRVMVWVPLTALSVMVMVAVRVPPAVGLNVAPIAQFAPPATEAPQVLVTTKSPALAPDTAMLDTVNAAPPLLVSVTDCPALVEPTTWPLKVMVGAERFAVAARTALPVNAIDCGLLAASSVSVTAATRAPEALGVNVTLTAQVAEIASVAPQVVVSPKSAPFAPVTAILAMFSV